MELTLDHHEFHLCMSSALEKTKELMDRRTDNYAFNAAYSEVLDALDVVHRQLSKHSDCPVCPPDTRITTLKVLLGWKAIIRAEYDHMHSFFSVKWWW